MSMIDAQLAANTKRRMIRSGKTRLFRLEKKNAPVKRAETTPRLLLLGRKPTQPNAVRSTTFDIPHPPCDQHERSSLCLSSSDAGALSAFGKERRIRPLPEALQLRIPVHAGLHGARRNCASLHRRRRRTRGRSSNVLQSLNSSSSYQLQKASRISIIKEAKDHNGAAESIGMVRRGGDAVRVKALLSVDAADCWYLLSRWWSCILGALSSSLWAKNNGSKESQVGIMRSSLYECDISPACAALQPGV